MKKVTERRYGTIPICKINNEYHVLIVYQKNGHLSFPKGGPEEDESEKDTALRELAEETGIQHCEIDTSLYFKEQYMLRGVEQGPTFKEKEVRYYPAFVEPGIALNARTPERFHAEIPSYRWVRFSNIKTFFQEQKLNSYWVRGSMFKLVNEIEEYLRIQDLQVA